MIDDDDSKTAMELAPEYSGGVYQATDIPTRKLGHIPLRKQYELQLQQHHAEIQRIQKLLQLLDENPAIEQFMNLSRGRY